MPSFVRGFETVCVGRGMNGEETVVTPPLYRTVDNPDDVEICVHHSGNSIDVGSGEGVPGQLRLGSKTLPRE